MEQDSIESEITERKTSDVRAKDKP